MSKKFILILVLLTFYQAGRSQTSTKTLDTLKVFDDVMITSSKIPLTSRETAKPVQVISREKLERSGGKDLSQVLNEEAGIVVNGANSNPGLEKNIYIQGATSGYTMVMLDGIPMTDPSGVDNAFDIRMIPLEMIDHIEILKGSQSTLYGTDAIGGVINIITKQSGLKPITVYGSASFGSYNTAKGNIGLQGTYKKISYNVGFQKNYTEGFSEAVDTTGKANYHKDGYSQYAGQASLTYRPIDNIQITPFCRVSSNTGVYSGGPFIDADNTYQTLLINPGLRSSFEFKNFRLNASYAYGLSNRNFQETDGNFNYKGRFHDLDAFGTYTFIKYLKLMLGINYQNYHLVDSTTTTPNPTVHIVSPYLTFLVVDFKGFSFEAGYRFVYHSKYGINSTYCISPAYQINKHFKVFASYTTGFKAPTLYELYGQYVASPNLKPEQSQCLEAGLQTNFLDKKLQLSVTGFARQVTNVIVYTFSTGGYINQDKQRDFGAEFSAKYTVNKYVAFDAFYTFTDGAVTTKSSTNTDTTFYNLIRIPKHTFAVSVQVYPTKNFSITLQTQYLGNRIDHYYDPNQNYAVVQESLSQYALLNLYLQYKFLNNHLTLFTDLRNLTNSKFVEVYGYNTQGFNITGGIRFLY